MFGTKTIYSYANLAVISTLAIMSQAHAQIEIKDANAKKYHFESSPATSQISEADLADTLIQKAKQKKLATHPTWLRLHYYEDKGKSQTISYHSKIDNPDFFISPAGASSPQEELEAFIKQMVSQAAINANSGGADSLACRFPARTYWLTSQLNLQPSSSHCPEFDAWMQKIDPQRFSVVFAGEYPDRAVSAFGHILLLIDSTASLADPAAVDKAYALNDTVGGNPDDPFVVYAAKSVSGGYPNEITIKPYTTTLHEYLQEDNRDVWTYVLDLTDAEVQQIMRHVWETKDLELPYYFTLDNCASEILRYIDVVRPEGNLLDKFKFAVVPKDVIHLLNSEGLITYQSYLPADKTLAQAKRNNYQPSNTQTPNLQYRDLPKSSLSDNQKLNITYLTPADNNALDAHARQRLIIGAGAQDDTRYLSLAYRGGFNGPLDRPSGYPQNFHLETGSFEFRVYQDDDEHKGNHNKIELQELAILRGRSFNPINTVRSGDSMLSSWGINLEATQVKDGSQDQDTMDSHLVGSAAYEKGMSMAFGTPTSGSGELPPHLCYALGTGMGQVGKGLNNGYRIGAGVNLGCRYLINKKARFIGEAKLPYWYHGDIGDNSAHDSYWQPVLSFGIQYDIDKNQAINLQGHYELQDRIEDRDDIRLAYVKYF